MEKCLQYIVKGFLKSKSTVSMHEGHGSKQRNKSEWFPQNKQWLSLNRIRDLSAVVGDFYFLRYPFLYFWILFFNNEHVFI